jgi:predicted nucleic acid-binding protein
MNGRTFIDSNVFLYSAEQKEPSKADRAGNWLRYLFESGNGMANLQVMNEITNVLIKRGNLTSERVFSIVDGFIGFGGSAINSETVAAGRLLRLETAYSWWDCLLLASAMELQCTYFLSEDMQDGHKIRGLTVIDPFLHSPPDSPLH